MLDDAEHTARLQRLEESVELRLLVALLDPVVHVAKRQHDISAAGRADLGQLRGIQLGDDYLPEVSRVAGDSLAQKGRIVLGFLGGIGNIGSLDRRVVLTPVAQVGSQNLHVPTTSGPDFHHGLVRPQSEESQCLGGMAIRIARHVFRGPGGTRDRRGEGIGSAIRGNRGGGSGSQQQYQCAVNSRGEEHDGLLVCG